MVSLTKSSPVMMSSTPAVSVTVCVPVAEILLVEGVGVRKLEPLILDSDLVSPQLRRLVASTPPGRGTKMVKVPLETLDDAQRFLELVRVKWESEGGVNASA